MASDRAPAELSFDDLPHRRWPDYPSRSKAYADIAPTLRDAKALRKAVDALIAALPEDIEVIAGIGIDGQSLGAPVAVMRGLSLLALHKVDSLRPCLVPHLTRYFELGDRLALPTDVVVPGARTSIIDDCLMSGGTALSGVRLLNRLGARCDVAAFVFELEGAGGRVALEREGVAVISLLKVRSAA
jgi:adenine phosphoribosyltransferase